jgi:hypothetical protein
MNKIEKMLSDNLSAEPESRSNEVVKAQNPEPCTPGMANFHLGQWMGRREAFGLIAGRCSAAEVQVLSQIREQKLYQSLNCDWEKFCTLHLHAVRRSVDREISYLRKHGPAFFTVRQLTHVSVKEYESIAGHITDQGVNLDGAVVALHSDNTSQVAAAIEELLKRADPEKQKPPAETGLLDALLKRCRTVAGQLQSFGGSLDAAQRLELGAAIAEIRTAAAGLGVMIWDRR